MKAAGVEPLARALRAMATELERDPALARRVADAMQAPGGVGAPTPDDSGRAQDATSKPAAAATEDADDVKLAAAPTTRVNRSFHPRIVTGTPPDLGMGVPDPFALAERLGEAGLRAALADLRLGSLRAMIREHRLDPAGRLVGVNDAAKLRAVILDAVHSVRPTNADAAPTPPSRVARKGRKTGS